MSNHNDMKIVAKSGEATTTIETTETTWYEDVKSWLQSIGKTEVNINDNCNETV